MKITLNTIAYAFILGLLSLGITSCKDDEQTPAVPLTATTFNNLAANPTANTSGQPIPATGKYTFFNLSTGQIVANTDSATTKWDIGFRSTTIIFNSGTSGPGKAAVSLQSGLFDDIKVVSDTMTFRQDNTPTLALTASSGKGWYNYNPSTNIISPIPGKVLVVRTADNKYAKIEIVSYYKDAPATPSSSDISRYYTFRYIYQSDGSKKLN
jgi:hypothetical protein